MFLRHLDYPPGTEVSELGPAALDALLESGDLESWVPLLRAVSDDPWGTLADTVLGLCEAHPMYGTSALWRSWIERRRRGEAVGEITLERRHDLLVSTLRRYVNAIGGRLELRVAGADYPRSHVLQIGERDRRKNADNGSS
jgi:hypothetical protein